VSDAPRSTRRRAFALFAALILVGTACSKPVRETATSHARGPSARPAPPPGLEYVPPAPGTYELPPIQPAADGSVVDERNHPRRLYEYMGDRYVLLSFVYTRCSMPRGCPLATGVLQMIQDRAGQEPDLGNALRLVTLSFDPGRDTPDAMARYAKGLGAEDGRAAGPWVFLTTASDRELQPILEGYGQFIVPERDESGRWSGDFSHVLKVYLIDRKRQVRQIYSTSFLHPDLVVNDVRTLMMEDAPG
jgi:cytochrome c peroxidase